MDEEQIIIRKKVYQNQLKTIIESIEKTKKKLIELEEQGDSYGVDRLKKKLASDEQKKFSFSSFIKYLRPDFDEDIEERKNVMANYTSLIRQIVPRDYPIIFHGNKYIGVIEKIIKDGGLTTPAERGEDSKTFATQIDVTCARDIHVSLEFAEPGRGLPYGAIFAFLPDENEIKNVLETYGSEVEGGVRSVNFRNQPQRLIGIITTAENLERICTWCELYGLDSSKVFTHNGFLLECQKLFGTSFHSNSETTKEKSL